MTTVIAPDTCPKWHKCNAPLCPLDPDVFKRVMHSEDAVCFYLAEAVKPNAEAIFDMRGRGDLFGVISTLIQPMSLRWGLISRALERAKSTGSRMTRIAPWEVEHVA